MTHGMTSFARRAIGGVALIALLSCGGGGSGGSTTAAPQWVLVPENPVYVAYQAAAETGAAVAEQAPERFRPEDFARAGGTVRPPIPPPSVGGFCVFPAKYDLRELGRATPAWGSDCGCGMCWTFATLGSLESSIAPGNIRNLSENHLQLGGWDGAECFKGGNAENAIPYLAAWRGPIDHAEFDLCGARDTESTRVNARVHVQNVFVLPEREGPLDLCWIKWAVTHLGGLYASCSLGWGINSDLNTMYVPMTGWEIHAVTILGWDDTYDRNRFFCNHPSVPPADRVPPGDGAFLVKDGSAAKWDQGHFWISYYDKSFAVHPVAFTGEPVENYARNYQWDPRGNIDSMLLAAVGAGALASWQGNVFTAAADEYVAAVGLFEFYDAAMDYEVRIYLDPVGGPTSPSGPAATFDVSLPMKGYFTAKLPTPVKVAKGQRFGVVLRGTARDSGLPGALCLERPVGGATKVHAAPGQSYVSTDGATWQDLTTLSYWVKYPDTTATLTDTNLRIKAFTTPVLTASASLELADLSVTWELHNAGSEGGWVRPTGQQRIQVAGRFEDVGDEFEAERYVDALGEEFPTDDGWVFIPPGERVTAFSSAWAVEAAEQVAWRLHALDPNDGFTVNPGLWKYLNDLLATPLHVLSSDPGPGATVNVPAVPVLTVTYDAALKVGPGLLGITLSSGSEVRTVYATVLGSVLQLVPSKPLGAGLDLGGTTWHLHVPKDAVLSASLGNPLVNDYDVSFAVVGVN